MNIHILPGDALVESFKETNIGGETVVCRECLIDGDVKAVDLDEFWQVREKYLSAAYPKPPGFYRKEVRSEFEKFLNLPEKSEVNFWFEHELFCQVNLWFCLWLLSDKTLELYRVAPIIKNKEDIWQGFGVLDKKELEECFDRRIKFGREDVQLGKDLWEAFCSEDAESLKRLGETDSDCFFYLKEVCAAAIVKHSRPKAVLQKIIARGETDFGRIFREFNKTEGIYGFGDLQVRSICESLSAKN